MAGRGTRRHPAATCVERVQSPPGQPTCRLTDSQSNQPLKPESVVRRRRTRPLEANPGLYSQAQRQRHQHRNLRSPSAQRTFQPCRRMRKLRGNSRLRRNVARSKHPVPRKRKQRRRLPCPQDPPRTARLPTQSKRSCHSSRRAMRNRLSLGATGPQRTRSPRTGSPQSLRRVLRLRPAMVRSALHLSRRTQARRRSLNWRSMRPRRSPLLVQDHWLPPVRRRPRPQPPSALSQLATVRQRPRDRRRSRCRSRCSSPAGFSVSSRRCSPEKNSTARFTSCSATNAPALPELSTPLVWSPIAPSMRPTFTTTSGCWITDRSGVSTPPRITRCGVARGHPSNRASGKCHRNTRTSCGAAWMPRRAAAQGWRRASATAPF